MKTFKIIYFTFTLAVLVSCGEESDSSVSKSNSQESFGTFNVAVGDIYQFDNSGKKAGAFTHRSDYWEFKAKGAKLRMAGRFLDDSTGVEETSEKLEYNNVYLEFPYKKDGKNIKVSCKAAQKPKGQIKRTVHADLSNSGSFSIELVLCRNTYTSETIESIKTPIMLTGDFKNTPNKASLY